MERKAKKRAREKDRNRFAKKYKSRFRRVHIYEKKKLLNYIQLVGKYALFVTKLIFRQSYANWPKTSPKKRNWRKMRFFSLLVQVRRVS